MAVDANVLVFERAREEYARPDAPPPWPNRCARASEGVERGRRLQRDHAARRRPAVLPRHGAGQGVRRHPGRRRPRVDVHRAGHHPRPRRLRRRPRPRPSATRADGHRTHGPRPLLAGPPRSRPGAPPRRWLGAVRRSWSSWPSPASPCAAWSSASSSPAAGSSSTPPAGPSTSTPPVARWPTRDSRRRGQHPGRRRHHRPHRAARQRRRAARQGAPWRRAARSRKVRDELIGPSLGDELRRKALIALGVAVIAQLIYLAARFRWTFAVASVGAMVHDVVDPGRRLRLARKPGRRDLPRRAAHRHRLLGQRLRGGLRPRAGAVGRAAGASRSPTGQPCRPADRAPHRQHGHGRAVHPGRPRGARRRLARRTSRSPCSSASAWGRTRR